MVDFISKVSFFSLLNVERNIYLSLSDTWAAEEENEADPQLYVVKSFDYFAHG